MISRLVILMISVGGLAAVTGCTGWERDKHVDRDGFPEPVIVVVAPVINLSDQYDLDILQLTDWVASELGEFDGVGILPVNNTIAALARRGKVRVETPEDARDLANEFNADATVVVAITEYDPYDPPRVGMIFQWYGNAGLRPEWFDPTMASRQASSLDSERAQNGAPTFQVQRTFNADHQAVLKEVQQYARRRGGEQSPYGWQKFTKSQELFVRYCAWSSIRTMLTVQEQYRTRNLPNEATDE